MGRLKLSPEEKELINEAADVQIEPTILAENKALGIAFCRTNPDEIRWMLMRLHNSPESFRTMTVDGFQKLCRWAAQHLGECLAEVDAEKKGSK